MRRYLYLSTAVAGVVMTAGAGSVWAQCLIIPDCVSLGYKEISCPDGNGVKCPFGNTFACAGTDVDCSALGYDKTCSGAGEVGSGPTCNGKYASCTCDASYQYTCTGTGYSGGSGTACGGKYTKCTCQSPYTWTSGACKCPSTYKYTCTGTGYSGGSGTACGGKYTKCTCKSPYTWTSGACKCPSTYKYTCSGTGYSGGVGTACGGKYAACTCTSGYEWKDGSCQKQTQNGAVGELYYCNGKVVGVQGTLPTKDQLLSIYQNKSRVNSLLSTNGGTQLTNSYYWSSTGSGNYYVVNMSSGYYNWDYMSYSYYVRPVLTSW